MKRFIALTLAVVFALGMLTACDDSSSEATKSSSSSNTETTTTTTTSQTTTQSSVSDSKSETNSSDISVTETQSTILTEPEKEKNKTYYYYAEKGAVITNIDSKTGAFIWKGKCESCGKVENMTHSNGRMSGFGEKLNTGFVCNNPKCALWGQSQPVVIGCEVTEE